MVHGMRTLPSPFASVLRGIALWLSFPLTGLVAFLALGPVTSPGPALAGGVLVGLGVGLVEAWALRRPVARWAVATALGLGIGSALAVGIRDLLGDDAGSTLLGGLLAGSAVAGAQLIAGPPLRRWIWFVLTAVAWTAAWGVSLLVAISGEQGFVVFGASGAAVFALATMLVTKLASRPGEHGRTEHSHSEGAPA